LDASPSIVELLNAVLTAELTAINQYFVHSKMCSNWGYERLAKRFYDESIGEMKDAEELIERILYLDGTPNLQRLGSVLVGENVPEQLRLDLDLERTAIARLNEGIAQARDEGDNGTRHLLEQILLGEERHADWVETQLHAIGELGEAQYLAEQLHE
jgi:bacterioferritin